MRVKDLELSILIPSRNETFLKQTIDDILANIRGDTEVIAVLDGIWTDPPIVDHPRVKLVYHPVSVGQRAATNEAARISKAKYVMKCDAHCAFDEGFDVKLMKCIAPNWTVVPRMYNLHAFDWQCPNCKDHQTYQGPPPAKCLACGYVGDGFTKFMIWKPRLGRKTDSSRFDTDLHFQYWGAYTKRPEAQGDISDMMCCVGACWMMHRDFYWKLGGMDENHGSWGQMGVEIACKTWLSGGSQVVIKSTWFSHLFRTQPGFGFPYPMSGSAQERARIYSRDLWLNNRWSGQIRPLSWLIERFKPIPGWHDPEGQRILEQVMCAGEKFKAGRQC